MTKEGDEDEDGDEDKDKDLEICAAQTLDGWETGQAGRDRVCLPPSLLLSNEYSYSATTASASRSLGLSRPS